MHEIYQEYAAGHVHRSIMPGLMLSRHHRGCTKLHQRFVRRHGAPANRAHRR